MNGTMINELGTVELSGTVVVSDPCYDRTVWCMKQDVKILPGKYRVFVSRQDKGDFGIRVACLMIVHEDYDAAKIRNWEDYKGSIGVDSGQCGIFDDAIYPQKNDHPDCEHCKPFYDECCKLTLSNEQAGILESGKGVVSSSGYGDGGYTLSFATQKDGYTIGLLLDYDLARMESIMQAVVTHQKEVSRK
jgi:hypothetical protein